MENLNGLDIQSKYLDNAKRRQTPMTIYMMNGFQVKGKIKDFDRFTIIIECDGREKMLYKNAVSTIQPDDQEPDIRKKGNGYNVYNGYR